jgi:Ni/Fe-hydrogenase subunit HybB-like protein
LLLTAIWMLAVSSRGHNIRLMFIGNIFASLGGMLYRFDPTTLVFWPRAGAFYFPSAMEMLIDIGVLSLTAAAFCLLVKATAILPASNKNWHEMEAARGMKAAGEAGKIKVAHFATADELK